MRILITGDKGFIGSALFTRLVKAGHKVSGIDIKSGPQFDLLNCIEWPEVDLVIHLAGRSGVRESLKDPAAYWMNNVEASRRLLIVTKVHVYCMRAVRALTSLI